MSFHSSLKARLEAYYSLIAPEIIANPAEWRIKFEQIYERYGGSNDSERKLSSKLAKKYGTSVRLLLVQQPANILEAAKRANSCNEDSMDHDESWYILTPSQYDSGDVNFTSIRFDPFAALQSPEKIMLERNPWLMECRRLDTVCQFALHLPQRDPLRVEPIQYHRHVAPSSKSNTGPSRSVRDLHPFHFMTKAVGAGPLSRLHDFRRQRVRIVIRYVNSIRGTLTGTLVAFDKHLNIILQDVEENYSMRSSDSKKSNVEMEVERRQKDAGLMPCQEGEWFGRKRRMKNLLVRGDNVVIISIADQGTKTTKSRYFKAIKNEQSK